MAFQRLLVAVACMLAALSTTEAVKPRDHIQYKIRSGDVAAQSVNLGSWFVAEYWMSTDSPLWKGVPPKVGITGEYGTMKYLGKEQGTKNFENHWSTWITEKDIKEIADAGLNTVRVTVGYWIVNDVDDSESSEVSKTYAKGGLKYLDVLINKWAIKYNLAVMVSLHAHEGSQNGIDHSAPVEMWKTQWSDKPENVKSSLRLATFIAKRYKKSPAFLGLNLMNEPTRPTDYPTLLGYYKDAYKAIRETGNDCIIATSPWLEHQSPDYMNDFMRCPDYYNVWHEFHVYYKWGWEKKTKEEVFEAAGTYKKTHITPWHGNPLYIGEWSLATPDEIPLTDDDFAEFAAIQMKQVDDAGAGWAFWAWRHSEESEKTSGWSMRQLLRKGLIKIPSGTAVSANVSTRATNVRCAPKVSGTSSSSGSGAGDADVGDDVDPSVLFTPERVSAPDTDNVNVTKPGMSTDAPKASSSSTLVMTLSVAMVSLMGLLVQ
ncbi:hypothetical protein P43SY_001722 [Pythium insidiosum]|uniref:glucan 1,3-beta-glucosidase n=1 Tax=Pythium insidiosum TaxID=114742 RepID=A0AAD5Q9B9_PYTIN|nr:hypothetical protein P43SY_001722 [Pythium insidiosum]